MLSEHPKLAEIF